MKRLTSRLQELYAYYRYGPAVTWRELPVIIVTDLPCCSSCRCCLPRGGFGA